MNPFTHNICWDCWQEQEGSWRPERNLAAAQYEVEDTCCWCLRRNIDGIYRRCEPDRVPCSEKHFSSDVGLSQYFKVDRDAIAATNIEKDTPY
jgi:hypothetical protein